MTDPFGYFVYVHGNRGPAPQKWFEKEMRVEGKPKETIGKPVPLSEAEWNLSLDELVKRYPVKLSEASE